MQVPSHHLHHTGYADQPVIKELNIEVRGQGLHAFTPQVSRIVRDSGADEGLCTLFIRHTSASLLIQENYDDSARIDLENWLNRLVPENDPIYTHTLEGADDMPAHIKAALTASQLCIPFRGSELMLGTWQGIYLWEHRHFRGTRQVVVHL
jgi:secondary thiamine-phosphate synthase enzyme